VHPAVDLRFTINFPGGIPCADWLIQYRSGGHAAGKLSLSYSSCNTQTACSVYVCQKGMSINNHNTLQT